MKLTGSALAILLFIPAFAFAGSSGIYYDPPIEYNSTPLKVVLTTLFTTKDNISYALDADSIESFGSVSLRLRQKISLEELMELLLSPRGLRAERDKAGIIHIVKSNGNIKILGSAKTDSGYFITPPLDFSENALKVVLDTVFMSQPECSYIYDTAEGDLLNNVTAKMQKKRTLDEFLEMVLKTTPITFYRDNREIYHIIRHSDLENPENTKVSVFMGKKMVQDLIRESAEKRNPVAGKEEIKKREEEKMTEGPLEFKETKLSEFIEKVLSGNYVLEVNNLDSFGAVYLKVANSIPLTSLLEMALSGKGLKAEPDAQGVFHVKEGRSFITTEKFPFMKQDIYFIEAPLDFQDTPLKVALETVLQKYGKTSYSFEAKETGEEHINMSFRQKTDIVNFLKTMLEPRGYMFYLDSTNILHIAKADGSWVHPAVEPLPEEKKDFLIQNIYYDPPFEFKEVSLVKVLREVFIKSSLSYSIDVKKIEELGKVTISVFERMQLENILVLLLDHRGLTFEVDERGMFHVKEAVLQALSSVPVFVMSEIGEKSEMSQRAERYLEKTMGELGLSGIKGLPYKEALSKIFTSVGRIYTDSKVGDISVYGKVTVEIDGGKTLGMILREILQPKGLTYFVGANGVYSIVKAESRETYVAKRIYNYGEGVVNLALLKEELGHKMSPEGKLEVEEASKTLTIIDTPEKVDIIENYLFYGM